MQTRSVCLLDKNDRSLKLFGGRLNFSCLCLVIRVCNNNRHKYKFINELKTSEPTLDADIKDIGIFYRRAEAGSAVAGSKNGIFDNRTLLRMAELFVHAV